MLCEQHRFEDNVQAFLNTKTLYTAMNAYVAGAVKSKLTQKRGGQAEQMYECTDIDLLIGFLCELEVSREKPINAPISVHPYIRRLFVHGASSAISHHQLDSTKTQGFFSLTFSTSLHRAKVIDPGLNQETLNPGCSSASTPRSNRTQSRLSRFALVSRP